ncbi:PREDICTED: uncharacterized protein P19A11.02c-like [Nanorana parkeri]|uniref:uncharacterized protein P19A11.02c-like n=1 Tax=Nanorana parkeri TaxID=125878 RepID=UPI000854EF40|nr:PREDICTED: uncharacterized protein P19A11.02c-like [Nanorana parkeri]
MQFAERSHEPEPRSRDKRTQSSDLKRRLITAPAMDYLWRIVLFSVLVAGSHGDTQAATPRSATVQITTTPQCVNCKTTTTTHRTTIHSTLHTNHTTDAPTTAHTNHTTEPPTTAHTNHTTEPPTTAHTNHTTEPSPTPHTNHTTEPLTAAHTNHTTALTTSAPSNHTSTPPTNHTTPHSTTPSPPSPAEYFLNGTSGVCLRIKAVFILQINGTGFINVSYRRS